MYYKEDGTLDAKWVVEEAQDVARHLVTKDSNGRPDYNAIKSSQLRKFYGDVKALEQTWINRQRSMVAFHGIMPQIKILKAKAAYARSRKVVPLYFERWLGRHVDAIKEPADFKAFLLHFEAVVGFCYGEGLKD